jgi:hypothetical protein
MRKILSVMLACCVFSFAAVAQVTKGDLLLGGTMGFVGSSTTFNNNSNTSTNVNFYPRIGLAIGANSILATKLGYGFSKTKLDDSDLESATNNFLFGLSWRKLLPFKAKLGWYPEIGANYGTGKSTSTDFAGVKRTSKSNGFGVYITPGLYYAVSPGFLLNVDFGGIAFNQTKSTDAAGTNSKNRAFQIGFFQAFNFGFDLIIGGKKK